MITVVGGGFAGVEAAWAAARRGHRVRLFEMRPGVNTPAHTTSYLAELVCSNSFKSNSPASPAGQLKAEMLGLGSLVLETAERHSVPGGQALAVDREAFSRAITEQIESHPLIEIVREEFTPGRIDKSALLGPVILATGPLTSPVLAEWLARLTGRDHLYFYDAVSPTVEASSLDRSVVFAQSRYDKGEGDDYLNCPFDRDSYEAFVRELVAAERAPIHAFEAGGKRDAAPGPGGDEEAFLEKIKYFSGCTPIEAIAEKGARSLAFGNFKPVGLTDPRTGRRPYAALQLRPENREKTLYSLVACQTRLKWGEQRRVFRMAPGLENAEFVRFGVIHRNTYLEAPAVLSPQLEIRQRPGLFVAGQLTGVEGYVESAAMGIYAGIVAARREEGIETPTPPRSTAYGSLVAHLQDATPREFSPMNINWGLFPEPAEPTRDKGVKRSRKIEAALEAFRAWQADLGRNG
ncbi:MAG TPA: methylenetetrahydrofolate--tRNA-(uracil(54)-C(5))-methyltransferase (FADH(2)-oxidizing) TrmFO [Fimbriimonadaceae bacterium]|nr:methylenetetrahydrofolate--tRNA-(uracil(54)-C(5))-methyltransferase (FADH(2)-oxidizing) TrmFO [Fimbriimonadaceae bacterium]